MGAMMRKSRKKGPDQGLKRISRALQYHNGELRDRGLVGPKGALEEARLELAGRFSAQS